MNGLNKEQKEAVLNTEGYTRILAGPGTGKTRTLTEKIKYLIDNGVAPYRILAITFTNKAAQEMKERTNKLLGEESSVNFFTFHGLCAYMLRVTGEMIDLSKDFTILDGSDQKSILRRFYSELEISSKDISYYDSLGYIEDIKYDRDDKFEPNNIQEDILYDLFNKIYKMYIDYQKNNSTLDFNDLILYTVKMLKESKEANEYWGNKYQYILVDEFQDTDYEQYEIVKALSKNSKSLTVVGDPDQTIYSWRGAKIEIINNFHNDFQDVKTISLIQNYRSTHRIVEVANKSISFNDIRIPKDLVSQGELGSKPELFEGYNDQYEEPKFVLKKIEQLMRNKGYKFGDFALLYRNNFISSRFESFFAQRGIQYTVVGSFRFWDRKEVKETMAYLSWLFKKDNLSFERIANVPARKFGSVSMNNLYERMAELNSTYYELINTETPSKLSDLVEVTNKYIPLAKEAGVEEVIGVFENFLKEIGLIDMYESQEDKSENIKETIKLLESYLKTNYDESQNAGTVVNNFINYIALQSTSDNNNLQDSVKLMTLHNSKGKEFPVIFIVGANEEVIPSRHALESGKKERIEEERRLFYVGITRAEKELFISYTSAASHFKTNTSPSRFIRELGNNLKRSETEVNTYVSNNLEYTYHDAANSNHFQVKEDNLIISEGDRIDHDLWGIGIVVRDLGEYIEVAFDHKTGIKTLMKGHKKIRLIK